MHDKHKFMQKRAKKWPKIRFHVLLVTLVHWIGLILKILIDIDYSNLLIGTMVPRRLVIYAY